MSIVPVAIDALIAMFHAAVAPVQVLDGDPVSYVAGTFVTVGYDDGDTTTDVVSTQQGMGPRREEVVRIPIGVWSASGTAGMKPHRDRAFAVFGAMQAAVQADRTLGRRVALAEIVEFTYRPRRGSKGAGVAIEAQIEITAL